MTALNAKTASLYLLTVGIVAMVSVVRFLLDYFEISQGTPFLLFALSVVISGWIGGRGTGLLATGLSVLAIHFMFLEPRYSLRIASSEILPLAIFLLEGACISALSGSNKAALEQSARARAELERRVEDRTAELQLAVDALSEQIDENREVTRELQVYAEELQRSNRELQDFASVASHDLQEPLRKIQAFGGRLKVKCSDQLNDEGRDYIDRMQRAASRMSVLIEDLLTFSRVTTRGQPFQRTDLNKILREVLIDLEERIEQTGGQVQAEPLPVIDADPMQMRQLFQNLLGNALKFHKPGEPPRVRIQSRLISSTNGHPHPPPAERRPEGMDTHTGDWCEISVTDNGIGFDVKYAERIFSIFQRLHGRREYEGTGIGLAVCRKIAERHGGSISATSVPGAGATFSVMLPVHQETELENSRVEEVHGT